MNRLTLIARFTNAGASGGPAGLIYGYLFVWAGSLATYAGLAELASL